MIGNTGTFLSSSTTMHNGHASPVGAGDSGMTIQSGGIWSGSSSPRQGQVNGTGTPCYLSRGARQCSSNDSNDSGKSSGRLRSSPPLKCSITSSQPSQMVNGNVILPKLTDLYSTSGNTLGPPIVLSPSLKSNLLT
ncbi:hypothetical protein Ciccas_013652 [Cichlidogyrus casuarinus]|uniref:Uncharacterized protein n=1 Tax=Cichlidogyrus casuarinus TaxID=1844966 RepID=A0ABD2PKT0_9PLAT